MLFIFPFGDAIKSETIINNEVIHTISGKIEEVCAGSRHQEQGHNFSNLKNIMEYPSPAVPFDAITFKMFCIRFPIMVNLFTHW